MTKIISGFPAVGKSVIYKNSDKYGSRILDSDSSTFSWVEQGVRNNNFPANYMEYISRNIGFARIIMISSHDVVREALRSHGIEYTLVYPAIELKEEYMERYRKRGNTQPFIDFISANWEKFITDIEKETFPTLVKLTSRQFMADVLDKI